MEEEAKLTDIDLSGLYNGLQRKLLVSLETTGEFVTHNPTKGAESENDWIKMLSTYLPKRYKVDRAFVVDSRGKRSQQIDIVIYDNHYSPLFYNNEALYVPAESVYAVIEVKTSLNKGNLVYASNKAFSVRSLLRTSAPIQHAGGEYQPISPKFIPAGVISTKSDWKLKSANSLENTLKGLDKNHQINFGCVLNQCSFEMDYQTNTLRRSSESSSLIFFFLTLVKVLGNIGTVPRLNVEEYITRHFDS